jgi:hypothetical protein
MAEGPRVFTVGPWGYRILLPGLLGAALPPRLIVPGFDWAARASLVFASGLLFVYLRMRGATRRATLLAGVAMMLTPSVSMVFENPFLVEPFALTLLLIALIAIEGASSAWIVGLALVLLSLSKEIWVLLLPLIFLKEFPNGARAAGRRTLRAAGPALWVSALMRWSWAPQVSGKRPEVDFAAVLQSIVSGVGSVGSEFLLGGFALVALLSLGRREARQYLRLHALTLAPLLALPLFTAAYTGEGMKLFGDLPDVRRLLIYAIPFVAALAVHLDPEHAGPRALPAAPRLQTMAMGLSIVLMMAPFALDRYSRIDLQTSRDGPYVLGFVRETVRTARKLSRGDTVVLDPRERKFAWGVSPPNELSKLRFFLRGGFGPQPHYGVDEIRMRENKATLIVPLLEARALSMTLTMDARESVWISALAGGIRVGEALVGPQAVRVTFEVPPTGLFRGDNPIELRCEKAATAVPRLLRLELVQPRL